jgi:hypothetical protein
MTYMVFAQYAGDTSNIESDLEVARQKFTALGATRVSGSIVLTGEDVGSSVISTIWDTADAYFDARAQVVADPEVVAMMQASGMSPIQTSFAEVYAEIGSPEGKYAIAVFSVATVHTPEAQQAVVDAASGVILAQGVNGARFTRAIAAGQQSGSYLAIVYADSLDSYLAASAAVAADEAFLAAMGNANAQIVGRGFSRTI